MVVSSPDCRIISQFNLVRKSFDNVAEFKYLGITAVNQNCIMKKLRDD